MIGPTTNRSAAIIRPVGVPIESRMLPCTLDTASKAPSHKASSLPQHLKVASPLPTSLDARHQLAYERLKQALRMRLEDQESVTHVKQCAE